MNSNVNLQKEVPQQCEIWNAAHIQNIIENNSAALWALKILLFQQYFCRYTKMGWSDYQELEKNPFFLT